VQEKDKFVVIASAGVWSKLTNKEVIHLIWPYFLKNDAEQASQILMAEASLKWRISSGEQPGSGVVREDITCIVIFLKP
jgi:serine/threonine protein phosphatase PrpC